MKRKDDTSTKTRFRSIRIVQEGDGYYFYTREGKLYGPFKDKEEASAQVEVYISVISSNMIPADSELEMETPGVLNGG